MELDGGLMLSELRPGEKRQTQINGRRVEGVNGMIQIQMEIWIVDVEFARFFDQMLSEIGLDTPISTFVGVGQRRF